VGIADGPGGAEGVHVDGFVGRTGARGAMLAGGLLMYAGTLGFSGVAAAWVSELSNTAGAPPPPSLR
jgi:hypothetical protein